jgi:3-oxoacyl-[acyl-carrier protein] reductase
MCYNKKVFFEQEVNMKKALITGGAGGIGEAICRRLTADGYYVYINYNNSKEKAEKLASEIDGQAVRFDISDNGAVRNAIENIGHIDLLINNAGISEIDLFTSIKQENADKILDINLKGTLNCARAVLPSMINKKSGNIINISSMWGQCGASCEVDYSASKAGIIGFTKALAKEVAPSGIRVNCIAPGFIMTEMNSRFSEEDLKLIRDDIPLGIFGEPRHIADAVAFLASDQAEYITGQILAVNGGMVI